MKGYVEIYRGSPESGELIHSDDNMIMDGMGEQIVNMLTSPGYPSATSGTYQASASMDTSNFNVKAMSIGGPEGWFKLRDTKYYPNYELSNTPAHAEGARYSVAQPYIDNFNFSSPGDYTIRPSIDTFQLIRDQGFTALLGRDRAKNMLNVEYGTSTLNIGKFGRWTPHTDIEDYTGKIVPFGWNSVQAVDSPGFSDNNFVPARENYSSSALLAVKPHGKSSPAESMYLQVDNSLFESTNLRQEGYTYRYEYDILKTFPGADYTELGAGNGGAREDLEWLVWQGTAGAGRLPGDLGKSKHTSYVQGSTNSGNQNIRLGFANIWAGSSILDNYKVFETHDADGNELEGTGIWDIKTEGSPTVTQLRDTGSSGIQIDSESQGDRVVLAHELRLEEGRNYKLSLEASGTDPIQVRMYRMNDNLDFYQAREWVDFTNGNVRTVSTSGFDKIPSLTLGMDSKLKARELEFTIPGSKDDYDAHPEFLNGLSDHFQGGILTPDYVYVLELVIPGDKEDVYSNTLISTCSLYDLNEVISPNSEFNLRSSFLLNSDFEYRNKPNIPPTNTNAGDYVAIHDRPGCIALGLTDLSGWNVTSPINSQVVADTFVHDFSGATYGSVRWEYSSIDIGGQTHNEFLTLRAKTKDNTNTSAKISQKFRIPDKYFEGWYDPNTQVVITENAPLLFLSFWENNEGANDSYEAGSYVNLRRDDETNYYHFSSTESGASMGSWESKVDDPYYFTPGTGNEWKYRSISIKVDPIACYKKDLILEFVAGGKNATPDMGDTRIHDLQIGVLPSWELGHHGNDESNFYLTSSSTLGLTASAVATWSQSHTAPELPTIRTKVKGLRDDKKYNIIVKYKTDRPTSEAGGVIVSFGNELENHTGTTTGRAYQIGPTVNQGTWTDSSNPKSGLDAHHTLPHTNGEWVVSSIGPIHGFDTEGFDTSSEYSLTVYPYYTSPTAFQAEFEYVRVIDSYYYAGHKFEPHQYQEYAEGLITTSENNISTSHSIPSYGNWGYFNSSSSDPLTESARVYTNTNGTNSWTEIHNRSDLLTNEPHLRYVEKCKNLGISPESKYFSVGFKHSEPSMTTAQWGWAWSIRVYTKETNEWISWNHDTKAWEDSSTRHSSLIFSPNVQDYPFTDFISDPIPFPEQALNPEAMVYLYLLTGQPTTTQDTFYRLSDVKFYNSHYQKDVSSIPSIPPTPTDKTLQPTSDGPGKEGHFLNYLEFSSYDSNASSLDLEQVLQHGCFLPGSGIVMASSTFGHEGVGDIPNSYWGGSPLSGVLSGVLNQCGVVNSDGYILENPKSLGQRVNGGGIGIWDSSSGFVASGIGDVSATREIKYILTLSSTDWKFLDYYYGGIGSIGLWGVDKEKTCAKLFPDEVPTYPLWSSGTGTPYAESLYNMTNSEANPEFKLLAKKTFQPGGLKLARNVLVTDNIDDYLTIIWSIKF